MNRTEHLLVCLAEECDEVGQRVAKALRFGLDDVEDALWVKEHSHRLGQHVGRISDADLLRQIAKLAGFEP